MRRELVVATIAVAVALAVGGLLVIGHAQQGQNLVSNASVKTASFAYQGPQPDSAGPAGSTTTINLFPAGESAPLSSISNGTNLFVVSYTANSSQHVAYVGDSPITLSADQGTNVTISGTSRFLLANKLPGVEWVLDSEASSVNVASGSTVTLYYYEVLDEPAYYSVVDGGNPPTPSLTYLSPPSGPSASGVISMNTLPLSTSPRALWFMTGTEATVTNPTEGNATERWETETSSWMVNASFQIPGPIAYYHQYYISFSYYVSGGGNGYSAPSVICPSFGGTETVYAGTSAWVDAGRPDALSECAFAAILPGSTQSLRWALQSGSEIIHGSGTLSDTYQLQYPLSVHYTVVGAPPISPPTVTSTFYGSNHTISLPANMTAVWIDAEAPYSISNPTPLSNSTERWITPSGTTGVLAQASSISLTYYQQFLVSASYAVSGGGNPPAPTFSYLSFGNQESVNLTSMLRALWVDGGAAYSAPSLLSGSTSTERWYSPGTSGVANRSVTLALIYHHQYYLSVSGGGLSSEWLDSNETAVISIPGVFGRSAGEGQRVTSYTIDDQTPVILPPTSRNITVYISMLGPHQLAVTSVVQYQLQVDATTSAALSSITPPTIPGDKYWYDSGQNVTVVLNGVWGRNNGTGLRLVSYSVNGGNPLSVNSTGLITAVSLGSISSPENLSGVSVVQYFVAFPSGPLVSITPPPIPGDQGWYDSGAIINATFNYSWGVVDSQRLNAVGYNVTGSQEVELSRAGSGTFFIPLAVSGPLNVTVGYVAQYQLGISGGSDIQTSIPSPTGDSFFDAGTQLQVTTTSAWNVNGSSRQRLTSFTLNGQTTSISSSTGGTFTTPLFTLSSPEKLSFGSVTQYRVTFNFTDSSGSVKINPGSFSVSVNGTEQRLSSTSAWFDSGSNLNVTSVSWAGTEVQPVRASEVHITGPTALNVRASVYQSSLKVTDLFGIPVSGADVSLTFGNKSTATVTTGNDGVALLGLLPNGTYHASVSGLAGETNVSVNPAAESEASVDIVFSFDALGIIALIVTLIAAGLVLLILHRSRLVEVRLRRT